MPEMFVKLQPAPAPPVFLIVFIHLAFALIGTATTLLGVIMPALASRFRLGDAESGNFFVAQFAGSLIGTFVGERLSSRYGFLLTMVCGLLMMSAGVFGICFFSLGGVVTGIFLNGFGIGLAIPAANLSIAALNREKAASALNILNFVWSGGAMICPALIGFLGNSFDIRMPLVALGLTLLLLTGGLAVFAKFQNRSAVAAGKLNSSFSPNVWQTGFAFIIAALLFFCVGAENSLSGWLTAYSLRLEDASNTLWTPIATVFWAAFLLGRLFAPLFLLMASERKFIVLCLFAGACGSGLIVFSSQSNLVFVGTALTGFGLAPIFPTLLAQFTRRFGETGATKWLFVSGTLGGAFMTWFVGLLSFLSGNLRNGLAATLFCFLAMIGLQFFLFSANQTAETN